MKCCLAWILLINKRWLKWNVTAWRETQETLDMRTWFMYWSSGTGLTDMILYIWSGHWEKNNILSSTARCYLLLLAMSQIQRKQSNKWQCGEKKQICASHKTLCTLLSTKLLNKLSNYLVSSWKKLQVNRHIKQELDKDLRTALHIHMSIDLLVYLSEL